jgi:hypothetical protein
VNTVTDDLLQHPSITYGSTICDMRVFRRVNSVRTIVMVGVIFVSFTAVTAAHAALGDPTALITTPSPNWNPPVCQNQNVTYDAGSSTGGYGAVARYEWDLDGDGVYETDQGTTSSFVKPASTLGTFAVRVRVTNSLGASVVSEAAPVQVNECGGPEFWCAKAGAVPPPAGPVGISINDGDVYTNSAKVTVHLTWPTCTTTALLANDGGFRPATSITPVEFEAWTLQSSGPERLPKTVYVRFNVWPNTSQSFSDDIILDETPPALVSVAVTGATTKRGTPVGRGGRSVTISTKARDKTSGVSSIQVTVNRKRPGALMKYAAKVHVRTSAAKLWVRVCDGAGNYSGWKSVNTTK